MLGGWILVIVFSLCRRETWQGRATIRHPDWVLHERMQLQMHVC